MRALRLAILVSLVLSVVAVPSQQAKANGVSDLVGVVDTATGEWHLRGPDGLPFIAFREDGALKVAHCDDAACTSTSIITVDSGPGVGTYASLATDPYGMPLIAYYDSVGHDLKVASLGS